ncbi:hypothetical protein FVE85_2290 [Porphyridium purpureum]|uniref:Uncharacterized protein n=1 Tax=Porphyridium purpureum TaxID=35688 RepID=A0A5J4YYD3_PORPP|nr:hypothetical protein FVE85_2290 [Porphyridium purpureum]|eukprot:POR4820..scf209_3
METVQRFYVVVGRRLAWRANSQLNVYLVAFCKVLYGMGLVPCLYSHESPVVCEMAREYVFTADSDRVNRARIYILEHPAFKDVLTSILQHAHTFHEYVVPESGVQRLDLPLMASAVDTDLRERVDDFLQHWSSGSDPNRAVVGDCLRFIQGQLEILVDSLQHDSVSSETQEGDAEPGGHNNQ